MSLPSPGPTRFLWWIVIACGTAQVVTTFDFMAISIALPRIADEFGVPTTDVQWALSAFLLAYASGLLVGGRLGDIYGRKRLLIAGLAVFGAASAAGAFANGLPLLIAARVCQGLGAALITPSALSIIRTSLPEDRVAKGIGWFTAVSSVGVAIGPLLGGALTEHLGWQWVFLFNVPTCLVALVLVVRFTPNVEAEAASDSLDLWGLVTIVGSVVSLTLVIDFSHEWGWVSPLSVALYVLAAALFVAFLGIERRHADPLVDLSLFRNIRFNRIAGVGSSASLAMAMPVPLFTLFAQDIAGLSPFVAGLALVPFSLAGIVAGPFAARMFTRTGPRLPMLLALGAAGGGLLAFYVVGTDAPWVVMVMLLAAMGFGSAAAYSTTNIAGETAVPASVTGEASGTLLTGLVLFSAFGVTIISEVIERHGEDAEAIVAAMGVAAVIALFVAVAAAVLLPARVRTPLP